MIREATRADVPAIAALAARIWRAHYPGIITTAQIEYMLSRMYAPATMERELAELGIRYACAEGEDEDGAALVAFASWGAVEGEEKTAKLHKLYIDAACRGRGLGRRLLAYVEAAAAAGGARRLGLAVSKRNATAIAAYRRWGFVVASGVVDDIGDGFVMDDWIMEKPL